MSLESTGMDALNKALNVSQSLTSSSRLRHLAGMQPTIQIQADLAAAEAEPESARAAAHIRWLEGRLELARERDAIQATRPDGCWCLGAGTVSAARFCSCQEGINAKALADRQAISDRQERIERLKERAELPSRYTGARFSDAKIMVPDEVRRWVEFVECTEDDGARNSVLLTGDYGTGKTWLATAALNELIIEHDHACMFITTVNLLDRIRASFDKDKYNPTDDGDLMRRVEECYALVLDDIGAERVTGTEWVAERLFALVNARYNAMLPTIFTSNLSPRELAGHLGERVTWRIVEMCNVVKLDGPNLRDQR